MKFKSQKQECDTFKYVKLLFANIGFCNYAYIYGYDYKQISKLPSDVDARKYLETFNKKEEEEIKKKESNKIIPIIEKKESDHKIILINEKKENENIFERTSPTKPKEPKECDAKKEEEKKIEKKIQPKNISKSMRVMKKESTWAPTSKKKLGPIGKSLMEPKKVINKNNFGTNNAATKKPTVMKNKTVKK